MTVEEKDTHFRMLCRSRHWPDPPEGLVESLCYRMDCGELYALVDGEWFYSREAKNPWQHCPLGPA